jgi:hypothetical protein
MGLRRSFSKDLKENRWDPGSSIIKKLNKFIQKLRNVSSYDYISWRFAGKRIYAKSSMSLVKIHF